MKIDSDDLLDIERILDILEQLSRMRLNGVINQDVHVMMEHELHELLKTYC